jgi:hypothetical protein
MGRGLGGLKLDPWYFLGFFLFGAGRTDLSGCGI